MKLDTSQAEFVTKRGDTLVVQTTLKDGNGVAFPLANAPVRFKMRPLGGGVLKVNQPATIVTPPGSDGVVKYVSQTPADTDTAGWFEAEWEVTTAGGQVITFPNDGFDLVAIVEDVT